VDTARGLPTTRDQILITGGAQHAITVVLATLVAPGERVLVEHPTRRTAGWPTAPAEVT
jgi:DNA-binding transcriptional MocR family regulator